MLTRELKDIEKKSGRRRHAGISKKPSLSSFTKEAIRLGAKSAKVIRASSVLTAPWVRLKCQYGCGGYGSSLCCPPHTPTPQAMQAVIDSYGQAILFESGSKGPTEIAARLESKIFFEGYYKAFGIGGGPCFFCKKCSLEKGCKHPRRARPSMEACGIDVYETVRSNGFEIEVVKDKKDPQHYFGVVLVE
ncbi:DUF2284 domain-containing protein [Elusimicrobiota bacterium]